MTNAQIFDTTELVLSANRALWGEVSSCMRGVHISKERSVIKLTCFFDGLICEDDRQSVSEIGGEIAGDFPDCSIEEQAIRLDAPAPLPLENGARWVFVRKERLARRMIRLGINVDHVATVRNARGGAHPDPLDAARAAIAAGADGITIHLREDRRHIRDDDVARIRAGIAAPLNFEMAATDEMVAIALATRPNAACLVPERRAEVTTEGGLDVAGQRAALAPRVEKAACGRHSRFVVRRSRIRRRSRPPAALRATIVELHTGAYAEGRMGEIERLRAAAELAHARGIEVHAGHGLTYANVQPVARLPRVMELNIGHFIIGQSILDGLPSVVAHMRALIAAA